MHLTFDNVNDAFQGLVQKFANGSGLSRRSSRYGDVIVLDQPITLTYRFPGQRVLLNRSRDANPFFHLYHSLWQLAGHRDVDSLAEFLPRMREFSDDGISMSGAYGDRWRNWRTPSRIAGVWAQVDQLRVVAEHLTRRPDSRRAVIEMWSVSSDLQRIETTKDNCCNTHIYASIQQPSHPTSGSICGFPRLDITVCNRSNDLVWGCLGEDFVQFSVLQEYLAAMIGVEVGRYHHFTNNLHAYQATWKPDDWLSDRTTFAQYSAGWSVMPLVYDLTTFDHELSNFVSASARCVKDPDGYGRLEWSEPFFRRVASPMFRAFGLYKLREYDRALEEADEIVSSDWQAAVKNWLTLREERRAKGTSNDTVQ